MHYMPKIIVPWEWFFKYKSNNIYFVTYTSYFVSHMDSQTLTRNMRGPINLDKGSSR